MTTGTTIDHIESCLDHIYRIRSSSLQARSRQHQKMLAYSKSSLQQSNSNIDTKRSLVNDEENAEFIEALSIKYPVKTKQNPDKNSSILFPSSSSSSSSSSQPNSSSSSTPASSTIIASTNALEDVLREFLKEYKVITLELNSEEGDGSDIERVEEACSYLIEKYLDEKLKPFSERTAPTLVSVRKTISSMIEKLAGGALSAGSDDYPQKMKVKETNDWSVNDVIQPKKKETVVEPPITVLPVPSSSASKTVKFKENKKELVPEEERMVDDYEQLNNEIRNVLSSLKQSKSKI
jgi:hypothetical protein